MARSFERFATALVALMVPLASLAAVAGTVTEIISFDDNKLPYGWSSYASVSGTGATFANGRLEFNSLGETGIFQRLNLAGATKLTVEYDANIAPAPAPRGQYTRTGLDAEVVNGRLTDASGYVATAGIGFSNRLGSFGIGYRPIGSKTSALGILQTGFVAPYGNYHYVSTFEDGYASLKVFDTSGKEMFPSAQRYSLSGFTLASMPYLTLTGGTSDSVGATTWLDNIKITTVGPAVVPRELVEGRTAKLNGPLYPSALGFAPLAPTYRLSAIGSELVVRMNIGLHGARVSNDLVDDWESGINSVWSRYSVTEGGLEMPIRFEIDLAYGISNPDFSIEVIDGYGDMTGLVGGRPGCAKTGCFFYANLANFDYKSGLPEIDKPLDYMQADIAAHEFGHILGLCDEYKNDVPGCSNKFPVPADGAMGGWYKGEDGLNHLLPTQKRYYEDILSDLNNLTGRNFKLGGVPPLLDLPADVEYFHPEGPDGLPMLPVSEPSTFGLLLGGLLFLSRMRKNSACGDIASSS